MKAKDRHIILPPLIGLFIAFSLLLIINQLLDKYYFPVDPDPVFVFSFSYYLTVYLAAFPFVLVIGILFQLFIASRIWNKLKSSKKFLGMNLWQLIAFSCLVFGLVIASWTWNSFLGIENFIVIFLIATIIAVVYWIANIYTLKVLEEKIKV